MSKRPRPPGLLSGSRRYALCLYGLLFSCGSAGHTADGGDAGTITYDLTVDLAPPSCQGTPTLTAIKSTILPQCDGDGCHRTQPVVEGLDLNDASAYASLVGVTSMEGGGLLRVKPGDPDNSFLWHKLDALLPRNNSQGQPMPLGSEGFWFPLSATQRALVYCWIQAGAPNN